MRVANAALELAQCSIVSETYEAVYEAVPGTTITLAKDVNLKDDYEACVQ